MDSVPLWGTYRPHALMSVRARRPHSPIFGLMYHGRDSSAIRHLASDHADKITSYGYTRHDGGTLADHTLSDADLNLDLTCSFVRHGSSEGAWALRVSGRALSPASPTRDVSLVFYAAAPPDEERGRTGVLSSAGNVLEDDGFSGDFAVDGGQGTEKFRVVVREPVGGGVATGGAAGGADMSETSSVAWRRVRAGRSVADDGAAAKRARFHSAAPAVDAAKAFLVEKLLEILLKQGADAGDQGGDVEDELFSPDVDAGRARSRVSPLNYVPDEVRKDSKIVLVQRVLRVPFEMDVVFASGEDTGGSGVEGLLGDLSRDGIGALLDVRRREFDTKFAATFGAGLTSDAAEFSRSTLANVLGGVGYFYGGTPVDMGSGREEWRASVGLLTATPSRALFPRGFMWDEGFHQLIVQRWNEALSHACLASWMDMMDESGWIPREQVLGLEARHRFPAHVRHLMVQRPTVANPPTLLLPLRLYAASRKNESGGEEKLCKAAEDGTEAGECEKAGGGGRSGGVETEAHVSKFMTYFEWLSSSQAGSESGSFRWHGRSQELRAPDGYPLTLASGLDDYPRGFSISKSERHLDLHCWVTWTSRMLADLRRSHDLDAKELDDAYEHHLIMLEKYHGVSDGAVGTGESVPEGLMCDYDGEAFYCQVGYVSVLPLALGLLDPASPRVGAILSVLEDTNHLRSPGGVRSLSLQSEFYRKGDDYWTGSVWMPFNYLVLSSLHMKYARLEGPYKQRAAGLYTELRNDLIENTKRVYDETGYVWENYDADSGNGKSGRQFTGWSALIVLIYAELYDGII